jgi:hypothetical protein
MSRVKKWLVSAEWLGGGKAQEQSWLSAERLIDSLEEMSEQERDIVRTRWLNESRRYHELWQKQRLDYFLLRGPMVIGATTVPVLISLDAPRIATAIVSLCVAILAGLDSLFRLDERWRQARLAAATMLLEGWRFLELSGEIYGDLDRRAAYQTFLSRLEEIHERVSATRVNIFAEGWEQETSVR